MAIFTPGGAVGQISGRVAGNVFSHNAGGPYIRNGTIPTLSTTAKALNAKAVLGGLSSHWASLTAGQRLAWKFWAADNPVINRLGQSRVIGANAAFIQVNSRLLHADEAIIEDPPQGTAPDPLVSLSAVLDIGSGSSALTFAATPLAANDMLYLSASVQDSAAINYVENTKRFVGVSSTAQATGYDPQTQIEAVFGALVAGQTVHVFAAVLGQLTGLLSPPLRASTVVIDTP